ncbi:MULTISPECIES: metal ABC transporter solute-binding protein, Zn/Mn family [Bacillaceae]|jgi:zinc transport system substrate-binding protein|uniref:Adhesin n=1 Tax=Oceanobacillus bengalensis TaxID=1435466 RepID=A0A494YRN7_9BACI|nr:MULTISPECIES: zinc ABC transporter substrate-binding protein [Bacillaceae]RKQ12108.1 adhesin [Oceanobacillus bengalensis]
MKTFKGVGIALILIIITIGCSPSNRATTEESSDFTIYTTIYPIEYAIERIAKDTVSVETVYPPGVDAHSYEPTSKDMITIAKGDAFIYLGAGLEAIAETAADSLSSQSVKLIEIGQHDELFMADVEEHSDDSHENEEESDEGHNHGTQDPHIWLDPLRMIELSKIIKDELITLNPDEEATYNENFEALEAELITLDERFTEVLEAKENKHILVAHAAFGYWEERYGIEQIPISGLSSSNEPSQKELTKIIDQAEEFNLNHILYEQNSTNRVSEIIQEKIGAEALTIHNLSVLTEEDIENNEDYISLMNYNLDILDIATK